MLNFHIGTLSASVKSATVVLGKYLPGVPSGKDVDLISLPVTETIGASGCQTPKHRQ